MSEITIQSLENGPFLVKGNVKLTDAQGKEIETKEVYGLCRCGASAGKPFCDGSHQKVNFKG
jgi:CDGSH iron-sulfur domain-containing protein 3